MYGIIYSVVLPGIYKTLLQLFSRNLYDQYYFYVRR